MMSSTATLVDEDFSIGTLKLNSADEVTEVQVTSSPKLEETTEMKDGVVVNPFNYVVSRLTHYFSLISCYYFAAEIADNNLTYGALRLLGRSLGRRSWSRLPIRRIFA